MLTQAEIKQKRRQKILARAKSEQIDKHNNQQQQQNIQEITESTYESPTVFERYTMIKQKEKYQKLLKQSSKAAGIIIVLIAKCVNPQILFCFTLLLFIVLAVNCSKTINANDNKYSDWLTKLIPFSSKIYVGLRLLFITSICVNVLFSYIVASVLVNIIQASIGKLSEL